MTRALAKLLGDALATYPHGIADGAGGSTAAASLLGMAETMAGQLGEAGVVADEPVAVRIGNRPADLAGLLAVWRAGAVAVPVHRNAAEATVHTVFSRTGCRFAIDDGKLTILSDAVPPVRPLLRDAALIIFTSGSTGQPKGVVIGHEPFAKKLAVLNELLGLSPRDTVLLPLQLTFIFGIWVALLALMNQSRLILISKFAPETLRPVLGDLSVFAGVPAMFRTLFSADIFQPAAGLRMVLTGGEMLGAGLSDKLVAAFPNAGVFDLYGLTETGSCDFCLRPEERVAGLGSIGRPTGSVSFRIDRYDDSLPDGVGELLIRTPFGMAGYLDDPVLTAKSFDDGYFRTGDLARVRPDGLVEIVGRSKDIVSRAGNKIAPAEIDGWLMRHPSVAAALCAGVADARLGEALHAVVVLREGCEANEQVLREWLAARIERFKVPDVIRIVEALPVGATGKALRAGVAELTIAHDAITG
ncbi:class I adenylate-forming enzyme family protein [Rhodoligotrophos ferricapiens]|uniref:class I adenylate-forming enzyme family protein n=1 Tax=Rhodoligotrophos ferricapiens TaxID=3069264 RepID=UPI00315D5B8C